MQSCMNDIKKTITFRAESDSNSQGMINSSEMGGDPLAGGFGPQTKELGGHYPRCCIVVALLAAMMVKKVDI